MQRSLANCKGLRASTSALVSRAASSYGASASTSTGGWGSPAAVPEQLHRSFPTGTTRLGARQPVPRAVAVLRAFASGASDAARPSWEIRMLYDGDCPLCHREVEFLRSRDAGKNRIDFVDIASPTYAAEDNAGIGYDQAMTKIHAITPDGAVITGVEVFRRLYEAVGLGWVYAITRYEPIGSLAEALYNVWAKYRMEVTGREAMSVILAKRKVAASGVLCDVKDAECRAEGEKAA